MSIGAFDAYVIDEQEKREQQEELNRLTGKLDAFCDANGLPHQCAMELLHALLDEEPQRAELCQWLKDFIDEWDSVA